MPYIGKRLLQVITDKRLDEHPIFFHVFSNGGAILYQHVSLAMQKANTPFKVNRWLGKSCPPNFARDFLHEFDVSSDFAGIRYTLSNSNVTPML